MLWILGVIQYLLMVATAFFGYVLPWGQMSFWGATVITNFFSALDQVVPHMGSSIATWLWGGYAVGDPTLNRFFSLHYLLPFVIAGVVGLHVWALHVPGNNNPLGIDVKGPQDTVPFHPYYTVKDAFYVALFLLIYAAFVFYAPNFFGNPDNYTPANPVVTPPDIVPEWYLLPFYAMLRSVPQKLLGVLVMAGSLVTLLFVPWLDTSKVRSTRFRPMMKQFFSSSVVVDCADPGLLRRPAGAPTRRSEMMQGMHLPLVWIARLGTLFYFAFFWLIMPLLGLIETPKPLPASIAQPVLGLAEVRVRTMTDMKPFVIRAGSPWRLVSALPPRHLQAIDTSEPPAGQESGDVVVRRSAVRGTYDRGALRGSGFPGLQGSLRSACHVLQHRGVPQSRRGFRPWLHRGARPRASPPVTRLRPSRMTRVRPPTTRANA